MVVFTLYHCRVNEHLRANLGSWTKLEVDSCTAGISLLFYSNTLDLAFHHSLVSALGLRFGLQEPEAQTLRNLGTQRPRWCAISMRRITPSHWRNSQDSGDNVVQEVDRLSLSAPITRSTQETQREEGCQLNRDLLIRLGERMLSSRGRFVDIHTFKFFVSISTVSSDRMDGYYPLLPNSVYR